MARTKIRLEFHQVKAVGKRQCFPAVIAYGFVLFGTYHTVIDYPFLIIQNLAQQQLPTPTGTINQCPVSSNAFALDRMAKESKAYLPVWFLKNICKLLL